MNPNTQRTEIRFPVGRIVGGSIHTGRTKDFEGKDLVYKNGDKKGQPRVDFSFGIAIKKTQGHWGNEPGWGQTIWNYGNQAWGAIAQNADFSWKVDDGDSTAVNKRGNKNVDREGFPGHWILWFSGAQAPKVCDAKGERFLTEDEIKAIKPGYYVQVFGDIDSNKSQGNPGLYLNHKIVAFSAYGTEIQLGMDLGAVGFGSDPLPAGASAVPAGMTAAPGVANAPAPVATPAPPTPGAAIPAPPTTTAVQPHTAILDAGTTTAAPAPPSPPAPPAPAAGPQMTAKAGGVTYDAYIAAGWSEAQMRAEGLLV